MAGFEYRDPLKEFQSKDWYFVNADRIQQGPFSFEELQKCWADGNMSRLSFVWSEGMADWCQVKDFPHFETSVNHLQLARLRE